MQLAGLKRLQIFAKRNYGTIIICNKNSNKRAFLCRTQPEIQRTETFESHGSGAFYGFCIWVDYRKSPVSERTATIYLIVTVYMILKRRENPVHLN